MMLFVRYGRDRADLDARLAAQPVADFLRNSTLIGTAAEIKDRVAALADAGVQRVMINWRDDYDDIEGMAALGKALLT
jgi:alkanesulfonate monooxygenase SsuD/methylene tetrahydromethanopterin reductase-like flavin-dependent oxidoreductase (luciferase family)